MGAGDGGQRTTTPLLALAARIEGTRTTWRPRCWGLTVSWMSEGTDRVVPLDACLGSSGSRRDPAGTPPIAGDRAHAASGDGALQRRCPCVGQGPHSRWRRSAAIPERLPRRHRTTGSTQDYRKSAYPQSWDLVQQWRAAGCLRRLRCWPYRHRFRRRGGGTARKAPQELRIAERGRRSPGLRASALNSAGRLLREAKVPPGKERPVVLPFPDVHLLPAYVGTGAGPLGH